MIAPQVCLLTKEDVAQHWGRIEWRLDATPQLNRFYSKEDIVDKICKDEIQVWTAGADLVLLTAVLETPAGKVFQIIWAHGSGLEIHWDELKEKFHTFAWMTECLKIEVLGRPGWTRKFLKEENLSIEYVAYSTPVMKPRMN